MGVLQVQVQVLEWGWARGSEAGPRSSAGESEGLGSSKVMSPRRV